MLDLGPHLRFPPVGFLVRTVSGQFRAARLLVKSFAFGANSSSMSFWPILGAVAIEPGLTAMQ